MIVKQTKVLELNSNISSNIGTSNMKVTFSFSLALVPTMVLSHAIMQSFNGLAQGRGIYMPSYDGPIQDVNSQSMACNGQPNSGFRVRETKSSPTFSRFRS